MSCLERCQRRVGVSVCFILVFAIAGCLPKEVMRSLPVDTYAKFHSSKIAHVVPAQTLVVSGDALNLPAKGRFEGAGKGMLKGAGAGAREGLHVAPGPPIVILLVPFTVVAGAVVGAVAGTVYGAVASPSADYVEMLEEQLKKKTARAIATSDFTRVVHEKVIDKSRDEIELIREQRSTGQESLFDREMLRSMGYEMAMVSRLAKIEFVGEEGREPLLRLRLAASVDLVDLETGDYIYHQSFEIVGPRDTGPGWVEMDDDLFAAIFAEMAANLAEMIIYDVFDSVNLHISSGFDDFIGMKLWGCCWICPVTPPRDLSIFELKLRYPRVDTVRPRIEWTSFPDDRQNKEFEKATGKKIEGVKYDLKIWDAEHSEIMEMKDIEANYYEVEFDLEHKSQYYWSVRACFPYKGVRVCTKWATSRDPYMSWDWNGCERNQIYPETLYRFATP